MSEKQIKLSDGPKSLLNQVVSLQLRDRTEEWFTDVELKHVGPEGVCIFYESRSQINQVFIPASNINYIIQKFSAASVSNAPANQTK